MVNETSEENLLEFSKKVLDAAFGPSENSIKETPPITEDPGEEKGEEASTNSLLPTILEPETKPWSEKKKVKINVPSLQEQPVKDHNQQTSSDSVTSTKDKNSNVSDDTGDISINSKEDTIEAPLRSPGFMEMRLKRKSILGSEEEGLDYQDPEEYHIETDNQSHLFWVPAHLHPEIAPNEFRKWLKNHAKDEFNSSIGSLRRRKSTLSKQYIPSEAEDDEETTDKKEESEKKLFGFDWESYGESDGIINPNSESTKLNILRRSLSLNLPPFIGGTISGPNDPNIFDRHSSPDVDSKILVPRMSPALKRTARTKIRRNSVAGEQNPRRFSAHRRTRSTHISSDKGKRSEDKIANIAKQKSESALSNPFLPTQVGFEKIDVNFDFDDDNDNDKLASNEMVDEPEEISKDIELDCIDVKDGTGPIRIVLKDEPEVKTPKVTSTPRRMSSLPSDLNESFKTSPEKSDLLQVNTSTTSPSTSPMSTSPISPTTSPTTPTSTQTKRTSAWSWLWPGGSEEKSREKEKDGEKDKEEKKEKESKLKKSKTDKADKTDKTEKSDKPDKSDKYEDENNDSVVKEKKISLSSIFSWPSQNKGKSTEDSSINTTSLPQQTATNKKTKYSNYNRLPIHVERAIYRLSHIKLANPRRPLHEQVLISNMMFWYLSLINNNQIEYGEGGNPNAEMAAHKVKSKVGKEKAGRKRRKGEKKSGLTKKGAGSSAEMAYKAPQYDMNKIPQQYMPQMSNEFEEETVEDYGDNDYQSEEEIQAHSYHHYNDDYLSDGTDSGYLDETNGRIESSHSGGLLNSSAEFDDNMGESSSGVKNIKNYGRSKSPTGKRPSSPPNGRSTSPTPKNHNSVSSNTQRKSVPPSSNRKPASVSRNRASSAGTRLHNKTPSKISTTINSIADDEDDDVPLGGLYKISSNANGKLEK